VSHGPCQWERANFDPLPPSHSSETPGPIFMKLEIYISTSRIRPRMQNFRGLCQSGCPAQIAESVNDSANSSLVMGSIPTVSSRKIYFVACCRLVEPEWACLWEGSCASGRPTFAGAVWRGKCLAGSQCTEKRRQAHLFTVPHTA